MSIQPNSSADHQDQKTILVKFDQSFHYPVCFTRNIFSPDNKILLDVLTTLETLETKKVQVFVDQGLVLQNAALVAEISNWFEHQTSSLVLTTEPVILPGGERAKNSWEYVHQATKAMDDSQLDRHASIIAVGGGAFLDMIGFAASIFHRGIQLIRIPTTTLAQNDAGIGVKNGINQYGKKNCLGTFYLPTAVINDFDFLKTLPFEHFIGGVAEAFKIALIRDTHFFSFLEENSELLSQRDPHAIEETITRCARHHLKHIAQSNDPFETGSSRPLDYGHWSAHKIEILSDFTLGHGQAVSIGIALDSYYAWKCSFISRNALDRIVSGLTTCGLPVFSPYLETQDDQGRLEIEKGLEEFRQHLGGQLTLTMPDGIGKTCEIHDMDFNWIKQGISFLKKIASEKR